ncbi:hypothetical protein [Tenacibaculum ovolyticum]|uniref:hypothetical protein n=1 Tax=Tenacibaculum ovolyticum TaxID=104270 RepID=UPI003BAA696F
MLDKIKSNYPVFIVVVIILLIVKLFVLLQESEEEELINEGNKTEATIIDSESSSTYYKGRKTLYNSLTLKYNDQNGEKHQEKISVTYKDYKEKKIGQKIEIFYLPENPKEISLVDYQKVHKTPERKLLPKDLLAFHKNKNLKLTYDELNKISYGWTIDQNDSTLFINERRKSFIYVRKDSIAYYNNSFLDNKIIEEDLISFKKIQSKRIAKNSINIDRFNPQNKPALNVKMPMLISHYQKSNLNFYSSQINDYSNKPWFSLVLKTTTDR